METGDESDDSIGDHLAFLDNLDGPVDDATRHLSAVKQDLQDRQSVSKKTIKLYNKISKKSRKLFKQNSSSHAPLRSRDLLIELVEDILEQKYGQ